MRSQAIGGPWETGLGRHFTKYKAQDPRLANVLPTVSMLWDSLKWAQLHYFARFYENQEEDRGA